MKIRALTLVWPSGTRKAQVQGDEELRSCPAGLARPAGAELQHAGAEPGLDRRHHLRPISTQLRRVLMMISMSG